MTSTTNVLASIATTTPPILLLKNSKNLEILRFEDNGDIFIKGNLAENDEDVVNGFRELLNQLFVQ